MVDVPTAPSVSPKSRTSSLFRGKKRMPKDAYDSTFKWALAVDLLLFWLPGAGTAFIAACRGTWYINGYYTDKMTVQTVTNAIVELVPVVSFFPSATVFTWLSYKINKANTQAPEEEAEQEAEENKTAKNRAQMFAFQYVGGKSDPEINSANDRPSSTGTPTRTQPLPLQQTPNALENRTPEALQNTNNIMPQTNSPKDIPANSAKSGNEDYFDNARAA